jgi:hypothetical protein
MQVGVEGAVVSGVPVEGVLKANGGVLRGHVDPTAGADNPRCVRLRRAPQRGSKTPQQGSEPGALAGGVKS